MQQKECGGGSMGRGWVRVAGGKTQGVEIVAGGHRAKVKVSRSRCSLVMNAGDLYHFIPLSVSMTLAGGCMVS